METIKPKLELLTSVNQHATTWVVFEWHHSHHSKLCFLCYVQFPLRPLWVVTWLAVWSDANLFSVPGDFNLTLLDLLIAEPGLNVIVCCNELNAGYAADGYARARGVGACGVTFGVGGLSVLNAIAAAYSENLPLICIVGGPNSNDYGTNRILHHTIGLPDFSQELRCFLTVTCYQIPHDSKGDNSMPRCSVLMEGSVCFDFCDNKMSFEYSANYRRIALPWSYFLS